MSQRSAQEHTGPTYTHSNTNEYATLLTNPITALYAPDLVDEMTFFSSLAFQTPPSRRLSRLKTRAFPWRRVFRPLLAKAGLVDAEIIA